MLLHADQITFAYDTKEVLRGVSLDLQPGDFTALLGPNGCGKTTLIKALLGLLRARGTIEWDGRDIRRWSRRDLARKIAYLPQSPTFESGQTVADVLRLGRAPYWKMLGLESEHDMSVIQSAAETLDLAAHLHTPLEELSGGQRQRVFIGRCLVQEPAALLLDEPDTFLDLRHQSSLYSLLKKLAREKNVGIIVASHDLNLAAAYTDRLAILSEGSIAASGAAADVLNPELLEKVYGVPMQRIDRDGQIAVLPAVDGAAPQHSPH